MHSPVAFANLLSELALRSFTPIKISQSERNRPEAEWIRIGERRSVRAFHGSFNARGELFLCMLISTRYKFRSHRSQGTLKGLFVAGKLYSVSRDSNDFSRLRCTRWTFLFS